MSSFRFEAPALQNWNCHGCGNCCRGELLITLFPEEKRRIESQAWTKEQGVDPSTMFISVGKHTCLGHRAGGACVFLDETGRCRIHARFGEAAKPLACRLYPLTFHPAGNRLLVGVQFSCPSAVANRGKPLSSQLQSWRPLADAAVPDKVSQLPPPAVLREPGLDWPDFLRLANWLDGAFANEDVPLTLRFLRALHQLRALEKAQLDQLRGREADEVLAALARTSAARLTQLPESAPRPGALARLFFPVLIFEYARRDTVEDLQSPNRQRVRVLLAQLRLVSGNRTPEPRPELKCVLVSEIEKPFGPLAPEVDSLLTRFFRLKIQTLHFCGRACYNLPLVEGFYTLALVYPAILWVARWIAAGEGRSHLITSDVARAISLADLRHGYSPRLRSFGFRWLTRKLAQGGEIERLCVRYGG